MERCREVGRKSFLSIQGVVSGSPVRPLNVRWDRGANRTAANDLAQGAERGGFLGGAQDYPARALELTEVGNSAAVVVKDFGAKEVDFTGEQHAHYQGAHPVLVPIISPAPQLYTLALTLVWTQPACLAVPVVYNTK